MQQRARIVRIDGVVEAEQADVALQFALAKGCILVADVRNPHVAEDRFIAQCNRRRAKLFVYAAPPPQLLMPPEQPGVRDHALAFAGRRQRAERVHQIDLRAIGKSVQQPSQPHDVV
jgi:hypothetical protein